MKRSRAPPSVLTFVNHISIRNSDLKGDAYLDSVDVIQLLNKMYANFLYERGLTEDFLSFMDKETMSIYLQNLEPSVSH